MNGRHHLGEAALKAKCIDYLFQNYPINNSVLIDELPFADGRRRADIVKIDESMDVFEIKSDVDNLSRLVEQVEDYQNCFDNVTIVTTERHLAGVRKILPERVGILLASEDDIVQVRKADTYKNFDKYALASFINNKELNPLMKGLGMRNYSKMTITEKRICLSKSLNKSELREAAIKSLWQKHEEEFQGILEYRETETLSDSIPSFWHGYSHFDTGLWDSSTCSDRLSCHMNISSN